MEAGEGGAGGGAAGVAEEEGEHLRIKCRSWQIILFESFMVQIILFTPMYVNCELLCGEPPSYLNLTSNIYRNCIIKPNL